ncbi:hypothetical protein LOK49_LG15G00681 [Camellia lanceoleosa]|uniref:Uncharacterized protein n=1 Tax=Camellia lanceoleosa TaxID=1840588 RepID=A0ACC0F220_9ERIC|nr:hypothetical protein LOK49_LG15G00681 [Camellia lanceoleosa]
MNPGQGGKLVRAAGTSVKILKEPKASRHYLIKLPSGKEKLINLRCRATIRTMSNSEHGAKKLRKVGQSKWLGWMPVVRGVAMNPVDHPYGGGEGRSKSSGSHGRSLQTPWGKPCKSGFKTGPLKKRSLKWICHCFCTMHTSRLTFSWNGKERSSSKEDDGSDVEKASVLNGGRDLNGVVVCVIGMDD